jgi:hypothetical protein
MLNVIMLNVIMLNVIMLNVVMRSVVMLSVLAPSSKTCITTVAGFIVQAPRNMTQWIHSSF